MASSSSPPLVPLTPPPSAPTALTGAPPQISLTHPLSLKLTEKNHLLWRRQALAVLKGQKLFTFLERTSGTPLQFSTTEDALAGRISDVYLLWEQQDQHILAWPLSSIDESILPLIIDCDFAWQVWEKLEVYFASHTRARVQQLETELHGTTKGSRTVSEYLLRIKSLVHSLGSIGATVPNSKHIAVILHGLPQEYDAFVTSITTRMDPYSVVEVEAHLMVQAARIDRSSSSSPHLLQAHLAEDSDLQQQAYVVRGGRGGRGGGRGGRSGGPGGRGRGRSGKNSLHCQLCHKTGTPASIAGLGSTRILIPLLLLLPLPMHTSPPTHLTIHLHQCTLNHHNLHTTPRPMLL